MQKMSSAFVSPCPGVTFLTRNSGQASHARGAGAGCIQVAATSVAAVHRTSVVVPPTAAVAAPAVVAAVLAMALMVAAVAVAETNSQRICRRAERSFSG